MVPRGLAVALPAVLALGACATDFGTSYTGLATGVSRGWHLDDVVVNMPDTLTVSEADRFTDRADIVWRAEVPGDRRQQVQRMFRDAVRSGASDLAGSQPVRFEIDVLRFNGTTERVREKVDGVGVNTIRFNLRVLDRRSGAVLAQENHIAADLPALTGQAAIDAWADGTGTSERDRVVAHLTATIAGWLGLGPDPRGGFRRLGY